MRRRSLNPLATLLLLLLPVAGFGQQPVPETTDLAPRAVPELPNLEAFVDGFMSGYRSQTRAVGAVVAIVANGETLLLKGYGDARLEPQAPVDPEQTLFRIGSISKTYVWTAVMQQLEQGTIDLDTDVNQYLDDYQVPKTYDEPVTLTHLLTHSAGFEENFIGLFALEEDSRSLTDILNQEMPARVRPPGELSVYSNHGSALAMLTLEDALQRPWLEILEQDILEPLGLTRTTFVQPVPAPLSETLSAAFRGRREVPFAHVPMASIGAASATAADMARYMRFHLAEGLVPDGSGERLLAEDTALRMQSDLFSNVPGGAAMQHGFYQLSRNGVRIFGHGGSVDSFQSLMALFPEQELGLFVSFNTVGSSGGPFLRAFVDHYFPADDAESPAAQPTDLSPFVGSYRTARSSGADFTKYLWFIEPETVSVDGEQLVTAGESRDRWTPIGENSFAQVDGPSRLNFLTSGDGDVTGFVRSEWAPAAYLRIPWSEQRSLHVLILLAALLTTLTTLFALPISAWLGRKNPDRPRLPVLSRLFAWLACLASLAGGALVVASVSGAQEVVYGMSSMLVTAQWVQALAFALFLAVAVCALIAVVRRQGTMDSRAALSVVGLVGLLYGWHLWIWNQLPF
ncbi:MAG: serine hydrolase domain-containing protein [Acidobacteriota bacterium]